MSTETDMPTLAVASFDRRDGQSYLRARTSEGVDMVFKVDTMALAIMGLTIDAVMAAERDALRERGQINETRPVAPDSPEGLEG